MAPLSPVVFLIGFSMKQKININTKPKQNHFSNKGPTPPPPHLQASPIHPRTTHPTPPPVESTPPLPQPNQPKDKAKQKRANGPFEIFLHRTKSNPFCSAWKKSIRILSDATYFSNRILFAPEHFLSDFCSRLSKIPIRLCSNLNKSILIWFGSKENPIEFYSTSFLIYPNFVQPQEYPIRCCSVLNIFPSDFTGCEIFSDRTLFSYYDSPPSPDSSTKILDRP